MSTRAVREEYARLAQRYDRRWAHYIARTVAETLAAVPVATGQRILDVGCGTGALLEALVSRDRHVCAVGLDASDAMLRQARARLPPAIPLLAGDVHDLPFADSAFDLIVSASSFHYWSDKSRALAELRRVLAPGGRVVITDWCDDALACRVCDRALRIVNRAHAPILSRRQCETSLRAAGFGAPTIRRFRVGWLWGMMTAQASKQAECR